MVAKQKNFFKKAKNSFFFPITFDDKRFERLIIEFRKIVPAVNGRRVTDVILFSPSGHIEDNIEFLL